MSAPRPWWKKISGPAKIGLAFGLLGAVLAAVGMFRGFAPLTLRAFLTAVLLSGISWGLVSWAIAAAVVEVEKDAHTDETHQH